jgi:hypothetical protein
LRGCIADSNTGGSSYGFRSNNTAAWHFQQCVSYNSGSDGLLFDTTTSGSSFTIDGASVVGCIFEGNGGYGINVNAANVPNFFSDFNAFYNNTSGARNNLPAGAHDVTLTGSPFTNAAGADFSLNNTASAGAACRAASFPGALLAGGTGYQDIGALQHQDSGSGGMIMGRVRTGF